MSITRKHVEPQDRPVSSWTFDDDCGTTVTLRAETRNKLAELTLVHGGEETGAIQLSPSELRELAAILLEAADQDELPD